MRKLNRPSPALVVALLALFVSLSGTAVAAGVVPLAKRALVADKAKSAKVADNARRIGGRTPAQLAARMRGPQGPAGATGAQGAAGPAGPAGPQGPAGPKGDTGAKGDVGEGLRIAGSLGDVTELPDSAEVGDAYLIAGDLHVWDGSAWADAGPVRGPEGPKGDKGDTGNTGPQGPKGPAGPSGPASTAASLVSVRTAPFSLEAGGDGVFTVTCAAGEKALSGGFTYLSDALVISSDSVPTDAGTGWELYLVNLSDDEAVSGTLRAVCLA
jgi:Collagen triple helix repeat (20 copies)